MSQFRNLRVNFIIMVSARSNKNNRVIYSILVLVCVVGFWLFENFYTPDTYSEGIVVEEKTKIPSLLLPSSTTGDLITHEHFMLSYNEPYEQAEWVAYMLKQKHLTYDERKKTLFYRRP